MLTVIIDRFVVKDPSLQFKLQTLYKSSNVETNLSLEITRKGDGLLILIKEGNKTIDFVSCPKENWRWLN